MRCRILYFVNFVCLLSSMLTLSDSIGVLILPAHSVRTVLLYTTHDLG